LKKHIVVSGALAFRHAWRLVAVAATMSVACSAHAQTAAPGKSENSVTVYGAYRWGGSVSDENTDASVSVVNDSSYALAVDFGIDRQTQVQLFYSHQESALSVEASAPTSTLNNEGLTIDYYHVGGNYYFKEVGAGPYIVGGIGATHVSPDRGDLNSETFLSGNLGFGFMVPLGKHVGLRLEARGYATLINSDSALFCGNVGCITAVEGDGFYQGEALAGLSIRF
jgi:hypothetical protein